MVPSPCHTDGEAFVTPLLTPALTALLRLKHFTRGKTAEALSFQGFFSIHNVACKIELHSRY